MSFLGSSKSSSNQTNISDDHRTQDNKVSAQGSQVLGTAGGALTYTDSHGAVQGGANSIFNFGADSNAVHQAVQDAASNANASNLASVLGAVASPSGAGASAATSSHTKLYVGLGVAAAIALVVVVLVKRR